MGRGVRYLQGFVGVAMHPRDVRCGAESAIYTALLASSRILMTSDGARSLLFAQLRWQATHPHDVRWGAESAIYTARWLYHASL